MSQDKSRIYISESIKDIVDINSIQVIPDENDMHILYDNRKSCLLKFQKAPFHENSGNIVILFSFLITNKEAKDYLQSGKFKTISLCLGHEIRKIIPAGSVELERTDDDMYICTVST